MAGKYFRVYNNKPLWMDSEALQAKLVQCIQDSLSHFMIQNAIFLAERLYAIAKTEYNLHVLATCFYRSGKPQKSYLLLKPSLNTPENRYLFALSCYDLGKYQEAEAALLSSPNSFENVNEKVNFTSKKSKK